MVETGALTWMDSVAMDRWMHPVEMGGQVSGPSLGNTDFQLPLKIFYWIQVRRLAWPLQDLEMLPTEPLLGCPGCVFWVVMLEGPATTRLQGSYWGTEVVGQDLAIHSPSILPSILWSHPVPFAEKLPQRMMFPPPSFTVGMVFSGLYSSFFLQTRQVKLKPKRSIFVSSDRTTFFHSSSGSPRLSRGTLHVLQDFNSRQCSVLWMVFNETRPSSLQVIGQ